MLVALALVATTWFASPVAAKTVSTTLGSYTGTYLNASATYEYLGIPYAQPPVGNLRLKRTFLLKAGNNVNQTHIAGPSCIQIFQASLAPLSEDCLYLRIHTPDVKSTAKLPVLVWIHGGGQVNGGIAANNGTTLVQHSISIGKPVIYVGLNYRLNSFGFLASKELGVEGNINLGLRDQRLALQWVHEHIAGFGGDPDKVTIFGESAGARSVAMQLLGNGGNPGGLFRGAIMQSGGPSAFPYVSPSGRQPIYNEILNRTACASLACLRALPTAVLSNATTAFLSSGLYGVFPYGPVLDPDFASIRPSELVRQGKVADVPFISGNNEDEGTFFTPTTLVTDAQLDTFLNDNFAPPLVNLPTAFLAKLKSLYPNDPSAGSPFGSGNDTFGDGIQYKRGAALYGDLSYQAARRDFLRVVNDPTITRRTNHRTWSYLFAEERISTPYLGVAHSFDVAFVFGTYSTSATATGEQKELSLAMMSYWATFAYNLNPNVNGLPAWPTYGGGKGLTLQLQGGNITLLPDTYRGPQISYINEKTSRVILSH